MYAEAMMVRNQKIALQPRNCDRTRSNSISSVHAVHLHIGCGTSSKNWANYTTV